MTQEEKAKRLYQTANADQKYVLESLFPELKESEDERIRKKICKLLWDNAPYEEAQEYIAWLELLFQKMHEAGYEWDAEKKELKKIEQKGMNIVEEDMTPFQKKVFCIIDTTIEEEQGLKQVCDELLRLTHDEIIQNPAWSEEDEKIAKTIINEFEQCSEWCCANGLTKEDCITWLKSLKPQNRWKPSDEQMEALDRAQAELCSTEYNKPICDLIDALNKLKE